MSFKTSPVEFSVNGQKGVLRTQLEVFLGNLQMSLFNALIEPVYSAVITSQKNECWVRHEGNSFRSHYS